MHDYCYNGVVPYQRLHRTCSSTTLKHLTMKSYVVRGHRSSPADKLLTADVHVGMQYDIQLDFSVNNISTCVDKRAVIERLRPNSITLVSYRVGKKVELMRLIADVLNRLSEPI